MGTIAQNEPVNVTTILEEIAAQAIIEYALQHAPKISGNQVLDIRAFINTSRFAYDECLNGTAIAAYLQAREVPNT